MLVAKPYSFLTCFSHVVVSCGLVFLVFDFCCDLAIGILSEACNAVDNHSSADI